jgi:sugar/nucleoside kinase (ribokinase family)
MSFFKRKKPDDFLAIGDMVTDAFIRISNAHVTHAGENQELCMPYADKVPFEFAEIVRAVGNSANAAVAAARLGVSSGLVANIGDDEEGKLCLKVLEGQHVDTAFIALHKGKKTNYHYVLWYDKDRTILVKHEAYDYKLPEMSEPKWIYLSSLGDHTETYHEEIADYLEKHPNAKLAFQPGTFQMKLGLEKLSRLYKRAEIFFCNVEEAERILGKSGGIAIIKELLNGFHDLGAKIVVITDGPNGSYGSTNGKQFFLPAFPDQKPAYERTGAGDAFASTTTVAIMLGQDLETAMKWGSVNAMSVVQEVGAQKGLLPRAKIEEFLTHAPEKWKAQSI